MSDDMIEAAIVPLDPEQAAIDAQAAVEAQRSMREAQLRAAYAAEADPLFFKWQRGEASEQDWLDKVQEVKTRYADASDALTPTGG